jgi:hypothetical protein
MVAFGPGGELVTATTERVSAWPIAEDGGVMAFGPPRVLHQRAAEEGAFPTGADIAYLRAVREASRPGHLVLEERGLRPHVALSADGRLAATRTWQAKNLDVWDLASGARVASLAAQNAFMTFTPDGRHLLVNPLYGPCLVYETATWSVVREIESDPAGVAVSGDGTLLAVANAPGGVSLLHLPDLAPVAALHAEGTLATGALRFSAGGDRLAVVQQQRVQVWDLARMRDELDRLGLAEGLPAWSRPADAAPPIRAVIVTGER